jgi:hypothetical protein
MTGRRVSLAAAQALSGQLNHQNDVAQIQAEDSLEVYVGSIRQAPTKYTPAYRCSSNQWFADINLSICEIISGTTGINGILFCWFSCYRSCNRHLYLPWF